MKLSGTIKIGENIERRLVIFVERTPEGRKPNVKLYDLTDVQKGEDVNWRECDAGAFWVDNWDEVGPPPESSGYIAPDDRPGADDDDIGF
ncbi:MAG: hypothetical protein GY851_09385 [bacterium]|nr:hypothetical protein [bacterium]